VDFSEGKFVIGRLLRILLVGNQSYSRINKMDKSSLLLKKRLEDWVVKDFFED